MNTNMSSKNVVEMLAQADQEAQQIRADILDNLKFSVLIVNRVLRKTEGRYGMRPDALQWINYYQLPEAVFTVDQKGNLVITIPKAEDNPKRRYSPPSYYGTSRVIDAVYLSRQTRPIAAAVRATVYKARKEELMKSLAKVANFEAQLETEIAELKAKLDAETAEKLEAYRQEHTRTGKILFTAYIDQNASRVRNFEAKVKRRAERSAQGKR